jgi:hypothetical protein
VDRVAEKVSVDVDADVREREERHDREARPRVQPVLEPLVGRDRRGDAQLRGAGERGRRLLAERARQPRHLLEVGARRWVGAGHEPDGEARDDRIDPGLAHGDPHRHAENDGRRSAPGQRRITQRDQGNEQAGSDGERRERDVPGVDGGDHDERDEVVDDGHREQAHA